MNKLLLINMMKVIIENLLTRFSHFSRHIGREYIGRDLGRIIKQYDCMQLDFLFRLFFWTLTLCRSPVNNNV